MSLVQGILLDEYIVVASDTRGIHPDGTIEENFKKVIRLNDKLIYGMTGGAYDSYRLIEGCCSYHQINGLSSSKLRDTIKYKDLLNLMTTRFNELKKIHDDSSNNKKYDICSILCGQNEDRLQITLFILGKEKFALNGIYPIRKNSTSKPYELISLGLDNHGVRFKELADEMLLKQTKFSVGDCYSVAKHVFDEGALFDDSINNNLQIEILKLKR